MERELRAQVDAALAAGIDITHLDSHMGAVMMPEFPEIYLRLGEVYRLPVVMPRNVVELAPPGTHDADAASHYCRAIERNAKGNPDFDQFVETPWSHEGDGEAAYADLFAGLRPGLSWAALHFTAPGDIEAISPDASIRIAEYRLFKSGQGRRLMEAAGLKLVGMRQFRNELRTRSKRMVRQC